MTTVHDDSGRNLAQVATRAALRGDLRDWGAPDRNGDATTAFLNACESGDSFDIPAHEYTIQDQGLVTTNGQQIRGVGRYKTFLWFAPAAEGLACAYFKGGVGAPLAECGISDLSMASVDTTRQKIAVRTDVCTQFTAERITVGGPGGPWTGGPPIAAGVGGAPLITGFTGPSSVGFLLSGWEFGLYRRLRIDADIPVRIAPNPNDANISFDDTTFQHVVTLAAQASNNPNVWIEPSVAITRSALADMDMHYGAYGVYWNDPAGTLKSRKLTLDRCTYEQAAQRGYHIYVAKNANAITSQLKISGCGSGNVLANDAIFLRSVATVLCDQYDYEGTGVALNVDTTVASFQWRQCFWQSGSTTSLGGMVHTDNWGQDSSSAPLGESGELRSPTSVFTGGKVRSYRGVTGNRLTGTLANLATTQIPTFLGGFVQGSVRINFIGATKHGEFIVHIDTTGAYITATSDTWMGVAWTGIGNNANKINVHWSSAASVVLRNNLGETITYTMTLEEV